MPKALSPRQAKNRTRAASPSRSRSRPLPPLAMKTANGNSAGPTSGNHGVSGRGCGRQRKRHSGRTKGNYGAAGEGQPPPTPWRYDVLRRCYRQVIHRDHPLIAASHVQRPPSLPHAVRPVALHRSGRGRGGVRVGGRDGDPSWPLVVAINGDRRGCPVVVASAGRQRWQPALRGTARPPHRQRPRPLRAPRRRSQTASRCPVEGAGGSGDVRRPVVDVDDLDAGAGRDARR